MAKKKSRLKSRMGDRLDNNYDKNKGSNNYINFLKPKENQDIDWYKSKKGKNIIDIVPYKIATDNHPDQDIKKGEEDYNLVVTIHKRVGVKEGSYVCLKETYGKPCPICEEYYMLKNSGEDEESYRGLKPMKRVVYNVLDHSDDKVKVFSASYPLFEEIWQRERKDCNEEEEVIIPLYDEGGYSIRFRDTGKMGLGKYEGFRFIPIEEVNEDILEQAISLDELLVIPTYEELKNVLKIYAEDEEEIDDEEEEEEKTTKRKSKNTTRKKTHDKCPYELDFGEDFDEEEVCDECQEDNEKVWKRCESKSKEE